MPKPAVSRAGDLWLCGPHRVLCGDAGGGEAVARLLGRRRVRLMVTELLGRSLPVAALPESVESAYVWRDSKFTREVLEGLLNHLRWGELVYDPFLGTGATLLAAESTGRVCCGMERDPKCVDAVVQRWQVLTGKQATKEVVDAPA
jgi:hypothetical protein